MVANRWYGSRVRTPNERRRCGLIVLLSWALSACGPGAPAEPPESVGSGTGGKVAESSSSGSSSTGGEGSSSTAAEPCGEVVEGDVTVSAPADAEALANVREIEGVLRISGWERESFIGHFPCLERVGNLRILDSSSLLTLSGLERLRMVEYGISIARNASLTSLDGLSSVEGVGGLFVASNPALARIDLPAAVELHWIEIGGCAFDPDTALESTNGITTLDGFESLESVGRVVVSGQAELESLPAIRRLLDAGAQGGEVIIQHNPNLPIEEVDDLRSRSWEQWSFYSCGNLGEGEDARCFCINGS